jgi:hypothetical protein
MTTTMAEPEWDEDTRNLALGLAQVDLCQSCGGPAFLCQDPVNEFHWGVPPPVRCHRTTALRLAQRKVTEETNPVPEALLWRTVLNAGAR